MNWGGEWGFGTCLSYTDMWSACAFIFGCTMLELISDINSWERTWKVEKQSCSITIILNLLEDRTLLFFPPDVPEDSFVGCIDISGTVVVSYILTGVHVWFLFALFYYFSQSCFKCIIRIHVLNICVSWLRVSHSADSDTMELPASESCKGRWNNVL